MKKTAFLVSCFAVVLMLSNVSVAQEVPGPCPTATSVWAASPWVVPIAHPGLSINPREVRRATRVDGRLALRTLRLELRHATPSFDGFPFMPPVGMEATVCPREISDGTTFSFGPVAQTGRVNNSVHRVSANNATTVNFFSVVRGGPRSQDSVTAQRTAQRTGMGR